MVLDSSWNPQSSVFFYQQVHHFYEKRAFFHFCSSLLCPPNVASNASLRIQSSKRRLVQRGATWFGIGPWLGKCQMHKVISVGNQVGTWSKSKFRSPPYLLNISFEPSSCGSFTHVLVPSVLHPPKVYLENEDWPHCQARSSKLNCPQLYECARQ